MIRRIVAVLLLAVVCAHPAAAGPCEVLADAIRSSFEADADLDRVYAHLSDGPAWRGTDAAIAPTRSGRARRATIAQRRYLAEFAAPETEEGFAPATTRLIVLRDTQAPGRTICRVRLVGENAGRAEDMRPADAASESARRMPMAVLEPLLPALARARIAAPSFDPAELLGAGAESTGDGGVVFMAGGARFQISLARVPDTDGEVFGTLARLVPELGNRERPLGTFRLVVTTRLADIRIE